MKTEDDKVGIFIWAIVLVTIVQIVGGVVLFFVFDDWNNRAAFGDMFGFLGSFFTGLAFAAVIYSLFLQRKELKLTQAEFKKSVKAQTEQADSLRETALLNALNTLVSTYTEMSLHKNKSGLRAYSNAYDDKRDKSIESLEMKYNELAEKSSNFNKIT